MSSLPKLEPGNHWLQVADMTIKQDRVTIIHQPVFEKADRILRTFTQGSPTLANYLAKFNVNSDTLGDKEFSRLKMKYIFGVVTEAKNPKFRNLMMVLKTQGYPPKPLYSKESQVATDTKKANERMGESNA